MNRTFAFVLVPAFALSACSADTEAPAQIAQPVAVAGPWRLPASTQAIGDRQFVRYTGSARIADGGRCTSTNPFACSCTHPTCSRGLAGTLEFAAFLRRRFAQIRSAGGFDCCRQNTGDTAYLSVHSIGRAIDLMIPQTGGDADNTAGDAVANWLVEHAQEIGVQIVIWDRSSWRAERSPGDKLRPYTGPIPHTDHIHMELSLDGAYRRTPFFTSGASSGGASCAARCEGTRIVSADCSSGDCAAYGTTCIPESPPRCGTPECPRTGIASVCLDQSRVLACNNGVVMGIGDCSRYGSFCSTAGVTSTSARCVLGLCLAGPTMAPSAHLQCSISAGRQLDCRADGTAQEIACPIGQVCSMASGSARCEPPRPECPIPAPGAPADDRLVCLNANTVGRCFNGNVYSVTRCGESAACSVVGGTAQCAPSARPGGDDSGDTPGDRDASAPADAQADASVVPDAQTDASVVPDAQTDASVAADSAVIDDRAETSSGVLNGGCSAAPARGGASLAWILGVALAAARKRRR